MNQFSGGREEYWEWFENENVYDQILYKLYNSSEAFWPTAGNLKQVAQGKRVILTNRVFILSKSINDVFPLPFNVFANPIEMISERGFPLLDRFSTLIAYMRDSGVIQKLYNDFHYRVTVLHHIRHRDSRQETTIVLTLDHMDGAFTLLLLGLFISSVTFAIELIIGTYSRRRRARRLWKLLRSSWRQVSIMRSMQKKQKKQKNKNGKKNATEIKIKWNEPKKSNKKVQLKHT